MIDKKQILGVGITNAKKEDILEYIIKNCKNGPKKWYIVTPNPELLMIANTDFAYKNILNRADLALSDGIGVMWAAWFLGNPLKERFTGVDLVKSLCRRVSDQPITVGFLGGRDGVAEKTAECLKKKYPKLKISFAFEEPYELKMSSQRSTINSQFRSDILFVAFGSPKQEKWIADNLEKLPCNVAIGVGGAFDMISGKVPRAPKLLQNIGLEWLFRLIIEPWRIKRQLLLLSFIRLVIKEKVTLSKE